MAGQKGRSGGARVGAGRKPRTRDADWLAGHPGKRGLKVVERPEAMLSVPEQAVKCPKDLSGAAEEVWYELAPFALEQHTLTPTTAMAFADLCEFIVLERRFRGSPLGVCSPDHRGMMQRVETGRARFRLIPDGK